ncbi:MAG: hypothetical protein WCK77_13490 [Verrucomicrobiota bacterium]
MKKSIAKSHTVKSVSADPIRNVLTLMGESLVAWRKSPEASPTGKSGQFLDKCLVTGREAYRLMTLKLLMGCRGQVDVPAEAEDIAQECAVKMFKWARARHSPFDPAQIDVLLADAKRQRKPPTGNGSPMNALLYKVFRNGAVDQVRRIETRLQRLILGYEEYDRYDDNHEHVVCQGSILRQGGAKRQRGGRNDDGLWVFNDDTVLRDVIMRSWIGRAVAIQNAYLDRESYRRQPLRKVLGSWTPMGEWLGHCTEKDRPKKISKETIQRRINDIKDLLRSDRDKERGSACPPRGPRL